MKAKRNRGGRRCGNPQQATNSSGDRSFGRRFSAMLCGHSRVRETAVFGKNQMRRGSWVFMRWLLCGMGSRLISVLASAATGVPDEHEPERDDKRARAVSDTEGKEKEKKRKEKRHAGGDGVLD